MGFRQAAANAKKLAKKSKPKGKGFKAVQEQFLKKEK